MSKLRELISKIFFPTHSSCSACKRILFSEDRILCDNCMGKLKRIGEKGCRICGRFLGKARNDKCEECLTNEHFFTHGFSLWVYEGVAKDLILDIKYNNQKALAKKLGQILYESLKTLTFFQKTDIIISIPSSEKKLKIRGYNQAELIADGLCERSRKEQLKGGLVKFKETEDQIGLGKFERKKNMLGAFKVANPDKISGKNILLIDDVYTSGATIEECAKTLLDKGAREVNFATLASRHIDL